MCPGGQGDVSVYGDLLFMSVEETRGRIDCGGQGAPGTVEPGALPRCADLRHQRPEQPRPAARRADLPRVAHALDRERPRRPGQHLRLQLRHVRRTPRGWSWRAARTPTRTTRPRSPPATRPSGGSTSSRSRSPHPRPRPSSASRASSPTRRRAPSTDCRTRCPAPATSAAAPERYGVLPPAEHQHLPRPHLVPGARAGRRRVPGQRHPPRHLGPREPGAPRRGVRPELLVLALRELQQRRHQGDLHRRVGWRHERPLPRRPTSWSGAPTRSSTSIGDQMEFAQLLQDAGRADHAGELRRPQLPRSCRCRVATSSCRPGTRAASR